MHDPQKREAAFQKDHAQAESQSAVTVRPVRIALWLERSEGEPDPLPHG
jgi:hypothetical protein